MKKSPLGYLLFTARTFLALFFGTLAVAKWFRERISRNPTDAVDV